MSSLDVTYCEGWDPQSRAIVGVLPVGVARGRDSVGEQYAVLLGSPPGPKVLIEVSWRHDHAAVWFFDDFGRREAKHEFRRLSDERLFLLEIAEWEYTAPEQPEVDQEARVRTRRFETEGTFEERLTRPEPGVGLRVTRGRLPAEFDVDALWEPVPRFGDWASLARRDRDRPSTLILTAQAQAEAAAPHLASSVPAGRPPWRPPQPLQPSHLEAMFHTGTRYTLPNFGEGRMSVRQAGPLRLPTGARARTRGCSATASSSGSVLIPGRRASSMPRR